KDRIPAVECQLLNLFGFYGARHLRGRRLDERLTCGDRDGFLEAAEIQLRVDGDLTRGAQSNTRLDELFETSQFDTNRVRADRDVGEHIKPCRVRHGGSLVTRRLVGDGDGRTGKGALLRIANQARDLT